jgi:molybdenum cofactor cytidylyltransferase
MARIGAIVLAAGASSRLGQPKQFLMHRGETLIRRAVAAARPCDPIVVVAGRDHLLVTGELAEFDTHVLHHADWSRGVGSSIRTGVEHAISLAAGLDAVIILVCDQPHVTEGLIASLIEAYTRETHPMVASSYADTWGVPALFSRSLFPKLLDIEDGKGARHLLTQSPKDVALVSFPEGAIDIDTGADVLAHLEQNPPHRRP